MADLTLSDLVLGKKAPANKVVGGARAVLGQGLGMGWGDEGEAWLRSKLGGGNYEENLAKIRDEYARYSAENPYTAGTLEFGGGMAPAVAMMLTPGGQPAAIAQTQRASASALAKLAQSPMARSIFAGGTSGAVAGAGTATEGERGEGAGTGALMGTALGTAIPVAMRTGKSGYNWLKERLMPTPQGIQDRASQKMLDALRQAQLTPQQIEAVMKNVETGRLEPTRMSIAALGKSLGIDDKALEAMGLNPAAVGDAQALTAISGRMLVDMIGSGGFPSNNFSNTDREFLTATLPSLMNDPRGNAIMIEAAKRTAQIDIEKAKGWRDWKKGNPKGSFDDFELEFAEKLGKTDRFADLAKQAQSINPSSRRQLTPTPDAPKPGIGVYKHPTGITVQEIR